MSSSLERLPDLEQVQAEKARRHLREYIRQSWPVLEPGTSYLHNWHIDAISEFLEAVLAGQIRRGLINIPPRYMKSTCVTIDFPTWAWVNRPQMKWLFTSYSQTLATDHSIARRRLIESDWYQDRWGDVYQMTTDQNVKTEYENNKRGRMYSFGLRGTVTGKGGDVIVVDDPHNPKQAESDILRKGAVDIFNRTIYSRQNDKKKGAIVVVMQRLHEADLSAECIEQGYEHLNLPAEAEQRTVITMPISGREIVRERGDILWPEREGEPELTAVKRALGSYGYAGQYQQRPSPAEGGMLKRHWWRFWHYAGHPLPPVLVQRADGTMFECPVVPLPESFDEQAQSWDMAFKGTARSDYVAGGVWGRVGADRIFLLDQVHEKMDIVQTIEAVKALTVKWPKAFGKLIEDKANGPAVMQMLSGQVGGLIAIEPEGGKESRVNAVSPFVEAGNFYLPHPSIASWVEGFIDECATFPNGANDDQVDEFTQVGVRWCTSGIGFY